MGSRSVPVLLFSIIVVIGCSIQTVRAMQGELRIYKEPNFERLRRIIGVSAGNLCYDMPCSDLSGSISSARWTGLPIKGSTFVDHQVKLAFYVGNNCTGKVTVVNTSEGRISDFGKFGMDNVTTSFAVLETSTTMQHATTNICNW
ncbi:hypothetical protein V7S43_016760 [Phytophthora oleae]|uniref:Uncharacterized protein n=1 Tax=Phytophthora oleae TaxID=2107226 RepID=A0ABD3EV34_9STRA